MSADQMFIEQRLWEMGKWEKKANLTFKDATNEYHKESIYQDKLLRAKLNKNR